jgi:hypothetical protein
MQDTQHKVPCVKQQEQHASYSDRHLWCEWRWQEYTVEAAAKQLR